MATATVKEVKSKVRKGDQFSEDERARWKEERLSEQKQMLEDALSALTNSAAWAHFIKHGRNNLGRLTLNNAILIWSQQRDATVVWGKAQWAKKKVEINPDAKGVRYFAPSGFFYLKDKAGNPILDAKGNQQRRMFYRVVTGYDITETNAPAPEFDANLELDGDDLADLIAPLERFAYSLGYSVKYVDATESGDSFRDDRLWTINVRKDLNGNRIVRTLVRQLARIYGNINYKDFEKDVAEVIVESATVMSLGLLGFDVTEVSVPYIASWGDGSLKKIGEYMKLVDELAKTLAKKMEDK